MVVRMFESGYGALPSLHSRGEGLGREEWMAGRVDRGSRCDPSGPLPPPVLGVIGTSGVEEVGGLLDPFEAAFGQLEGGGDLLQEALALQPLARGLQVPRV